MTEGSREKKEIQNRIHSKRGPSAETQETRTVILYSVSPENFLSLPDSGVGRVPDHTSDNTPTTPPRRDTVLSGDRGTRGVYVYQMSFASPFGAPIRK